MKYKPNEISYYKSRHISKEKLSKKNKSIDTLYLDLYTYKDNLDKIKLMNIKNMVINTDKLKLSNKSEEYLIINDTKAENIYFLNKPNLGGITYPIDMADYNLRCQFNEFELCNIKEINILLPINKVVKIEIPNNSNSIIISADKLDTGFIEVSVEIKTSKMHIEYFIEELRGIKKINKYMYRYGNSDIKNGVLDLTNISQYKEVFSNYLDVDELIINKNDLDTFKFRKAFFDKIKLKTLKIKDTNDMRLNPIKEIEMIGELIIGKGYLLNDDRDKFIYLDKNRELKVIEKKDLLKNETIEKIDFIYNKKVTLIVIKNKDGTYKLMYKDITYDIDKIFNKFLLLNINSYNINEKVLNNLINYINNNDYFAIFNEKIISNDLLNTIYKDYVEFIKHIIELKKIGFTDEAIFYLLKRKYVNIINSKSDNILDINSITTDEIDMFNELGKKEIKKKLKK